VISTTQHAQQESTQVHPFKSFDKTFTKYYDKQNPIYFWFALLKFIQHCVLCLGLKKVTNLTNLSPLRFITLTNYNWLTLASKTNPAKQKTKNKSINNLSSAAKENKRVNDHKQIMFSNKKIGEELTKAKAVYFIWACTSFFSRLLINIYIYIFELNEKTRMCVTL